MRVPDSYPQGSAYLGIIVDEFAQLDECDETNNTAFIPVEITPAADLVITTSSPFTAVPQTVEPGEATQISSYTIANIGTVQANQINNGFYLSTDSILTVDDIYLTGNSNSVIFPGETFDWFGGNLQIPANTVPGTYYVGVLTDIDDNIPEWNEANNFISTQIEVSLPTDVVETDSDVLPNNYVLSQNYPNPFNPTTTIGFNLPQRTDVSLEIYNVVGQIVTTLVNESLPAGNYSVDWSGNDISGNSVASGIYFYRLRAGEYNLSRKMVYLK